MSTYEGEHRPKYRDPLFWRDWAERVFWTLAQAGLGLIVVESFDFPAWAIPVIATGLAAVKGYVARQIGRTGTASTAPGV